LDDEEATVFLRRYSRTKDGKTHTSDSKKPPETALFRSSSEDSIYFVA
jgi:hypothetical protein